MVLGLFLNFSQANAFAEYVSEGERVFENILTPSKKFQQYGVRINRIVLTGNTDDTRYLTAEEKEKYNFAGVIMAPGVKAGTGFVAYSRLIVVTVAHAFYNKGKFRASLDSYRFVIGEDLQGKGRHKQYRICDLWVGTTYPGKFYHRDIGIIKLCEPVDDKINTLKVSDPSKIEARERNGSVVSVSFPRIHDEGLVPRIMECQGNIEKGNLHQPWARANNIIHAHDCDTWGGASGAPIIDRDKFILDSVHRGSYRLIGKDRRLRSSYINFGVGVDEEFYKNLKKMAEPNTQVTNDGESIKSSQISSPN